jgi:flavin-dependent dehydrogenase
VERVDALVVGAGPAGSAAAIHLARAGARVLLAEKASFPRDKPCGGGLTGRALKAIPVDPSPVVERDVDRFRLRLRYGSSFARRHDEPLIRMTQRLRLDAFLAEEAARAGAELREDARVERLEVHPTGVTARVAGSEVRADVVVGADGANGVVARSAGLGKEIVRGVALEGNIALGSLDEDLARSVEHLDGDLPVRHGTEAEPPRVKGDAGVSRRVVPDQPVVGAGRTVDCFLNVEVVGILRHSFDQPFEAR